MPCFEAPFEVLGAGMEVLKGALALEVRRDKKETICAGEEAWEVGEGVEKGIEGRLRVNSPGGGCPVG